MIERGGIVPTKIKDMTCYFPNQTNGVNLNTPEKVKSFLK